MKCIVRQVALRYYSADGDSQIEDMDPAFKKCGPLSYAASRGTGIFLNSMALWTVRSLFVSRRHLSSSRRNECGVSFFHGLL